MRYDMTPKPTAPRNYRLPVSLLIWAVLVIGYVRVFDDGMWRQLIAAKNYTLFSSQVRLQVLTIIALPIIAILVRWCYRKASN